MLFSILVPVYNVETYLPECLASIAGQDFDDYELILVDDGSTDRSGAMCDEYAASHTNTVVIHKENAGLISARRRGIAEAKGDYCLFCDSDDLYEAGAFRKIADVLGQHDIDLLLYNAFTYDGTNKAIFFEHCLPAGFVTDKTVLYDKLLLTYELNSMCIKAIRRELLDADRDYTDMYSCNFGEDLLQTMPVVMKAQTIFYLDEALYIYRDMAGMMHKYHSQYYWSYRKVNARVREYLADMPLADKAAKLGLHLLTAAYGGSTQLKYTREASARDDVRRIADDKDFRQAYQAVREAGYMQHLSAKQKLILSLLYARRIEIISLILSVRGSN